MKVTEVLPGSPCWAQLNTSDLEASKTFYSALFGWDAHTDPDPEFGGYTMFLKDGAPVGAAAPLMNPQQPVQWLTSFDTKDVDAAAAKAKAGGAQVWMEPMDVARLGRWALLSDPTGAPFTLWQAKEFAGFGLVDEPDTFGWIDLATRDKDVAVRFYADLFGWEVTPDDMYPMVGFAGTMFGGVMDMGDRFPDDVPAHWTPFYLVADVDVTAAKAGSLGAEAMYGPADVEMQDGPRIAVFRDPQGAGFGVFTPRV